MNERETFKAMLESFNKEVFYAKSCIDIYFDMAYNNRHKDENWEEVYKLAPAFFSFSRIALQEKSMMTISRLYENSDRSDFNIFKILNYAAGKSKKIDKEKYLKINELTLLYKSELPKMKEIADKISYFRDKVIAHNDNNHFLKAENKEYPDSASYEQYNEILNFAMKLLNGYNNLIFNAIAVTNSQNDVGNLITYCLKNKIINNKKD